MTQKTNGNDTQIIDKAMDGKPSTAGSKVGISVVVLTFNEARHLRRCLENVRQVADAVCVVDCFSTDGTVDLARELSAQVVQHVWEGNQARQMDWALENLPIQTPWVLRLDADEYLTEELIQEIRERLPQLPDDVTGVVLNLRRVFLGRRIKRGNPPVKLLRLFRYGKAVCEQRWMDEHICLTEGRSVEFSGDFVDHNLNDLGWWTAKHNNYAVREAIDLLDIELGLLGGGGAQATGLSPQAAAKRAKKVRYARQPLFMRPFAYFLYRYIFKLGFTEGAEGFLWHFLQGWWYRTLVDAKIFEIKRACGTDLNRIREFIKTHYNIDLASK